MADDPNHFFENIKVINIVIINHQCRGYPLKKSIKECKTVYNDYLKNYPENEKKSYVCNF